MAETLITSGTINPTQWPLARVWLEVSTYLAVPPRKIDRLEFWQHQIWVKIIGQRATLVSFRVLPLWVEQGLAAIKLCSDRSSLDNLGEIFSTEIARYPKHYSSQTIQQWRKVWAQQAKQLKHQETLKIQEEERLKPLREREQACKQWLDGWQVIFKHCQSLKALDSLAPEVKRQIQEFSDVEEAPMAMQLWHKRHQELDQATA